MDFQRTKARLQPRGSHVTHAISAPSRLAPPLVHQRYITCLLKSFNRVDIYSSTQHRGGSVAEWLARWTPAQKGLGSNLRRTVHPHRAFIYHAAKLVAALLRVARVTAGLAESNGSLPPGL